VYAWLRNVRIKKLGRVLLAVKRRRKQTCKEPLKAGEMLISKYKSST